MLHDPVFNMRNLRTFAVVFCIIWLIPANLLLGCTRSSETCLLGDYTFLFFMILAVYCLIPLVLLAFAFFIARPSHLKAIARPFRWLQRFPVIFVVLALGLIEAWYYVRVIMFETRFWGIGAEYRQFVVFLTLFEVYIFGLLFFFGREGENLRDAALNLGLLVSSLSLAFILFSFGYALVIKGNVYRFHRNFNTVFNQADPYLGVKPIPNLRDAGVYFEEEDAYVPLSTDANGFRNPGDVSDAPIAVIGDSFIFGMFASDAELWSTGMAQELDMPVANYSVPGYQLWQYNVLAERYVGPANHQIVVYGIFANDLRLEEDAEREVLSLQHKEVWPYLSPVHFTINAFLSKSPVTQLVDWLGTQTADNESAVEEEIPELPYGLYPMCVPWSLMYEGTDAQNQRLIEHLDKAISLAEANGYQVIFTTIPSKETIYADILLPYCDAKAETVIQRERAGYQFICDYVESQGQLCYDMTEDFRAAADDLGLLYFRVDGHWNAEGNKVFADLLIAYIGEHHLLDELSK